jgi:hypothetical protein
MFVEKGNVLMLSQKEDSITFEKVSGLEKRVIIAVSCGQELNSPTSYVTAVDGDISNM